MMKLKKQELWNKYLWDQVCLLSTSEQNSFLTDADSWYLSPCEESRAALLLLFPLSFFQAAWGGDVSGTQSHEHSAGTVRSLSFMTGRAKGGKRQLCPHIQHPGTCPCCHRGGHSSSEGALGHLHPLRGALLDKQGISRGVAEPWLAADPNKHGCTEKETR